MSKLARILDLKIRHAGIASPTSALMICNHISWLDIVCLSSLTPVTFVAKGSVQHWPVIGFLARHSGTLFIDREDKSQIKKTQQDISNMINSGCSVVIFPEGTTTNGKGLNKFSPSLLQAGIDLQCKIQACSIQFYSGTSTDNPAPFIGDDNFASHLHRVFRFGRIVATVNFYPVFYGSEAKNRKELATRIWRQINRGLFPFGMSDKQNQKDSNIEMESLAYETNNQETLANSTHPH